MDSPIFSSPSKALNPVSPERINQQIMPSSPSRSDISDFQRGKKPRGISDVQARVAFLNNLSRGNSPASTPPPPPPPQPAMSSGGSAALQRAIIGREEAESALASVSAELSEAQSRERRISERLESLLEQLQATKERQAHERTVFEKEIRKARKEAFRAGSVLVKTQEELKHVRSEAKGYKEEVHIERAAKEQAKQEAFERAYALAGLTEELEALKGRLRNAEAKSHSDTIEARAQEMHKEDMGGISLAEGDLGLLSTPTPRRPKRSAEDLLNSPLANSTSLRSTQDTPPKRQRLSDVTPRKEDQNTVSPSIQQDMIDDLEETLMQERKLRIDAEDMIQFLRTECEFKRCSCRLAEEYETSDIHDPVLTGKENKDHIQEALEEANATHHEPQPGEICRSDAPLGFSFQQSRFTDVAVKPERDEEQPEEEPLITFSPVTGTFRTIPSPARSPAKPPQEEALSLSESSVPHIHVQDESISFPQPPSPLVEREASRQEFPFAPTAKTEVPIQPWNSESLQYSVEEEPNLMEHSNTKKVPLRSEASLPNDVPHVPGTPIDREEALAQIRARRGRNNTMKRSVSANEATLRAGGMGVTPVRTARRMPGAQGSELRKDGEKGSRRDLSAPVRMLHTLR